MEQNVLNATDVTKIYLIYQDGKGYKRREIVKLRYMDNKSSYFVGQTLINFMKPKWRAKADIVVYTPDGIYTSTVIIRDVTYAISELMYKLDIPKNWKFKQLRSGSRKVVNLPVEISFTDGLKIKGETFDLAQGGFSLLSTQELDTIHKRFPAKCKIQFPKEEIINFPDGLLEAETLFVRLKPIEKSYELRNHNKLCFKFLKLSSDELMVLKNFLLKQI